VKRIYYSPVIQLIVLDNEISLALQSAPPDGPGEIVSLAPEYINNNPYKATMA
jgi:hypothetical protein